MPQHGKSLVRYAVVGLGHIAQVAMLPAFAHARRNSRITALVSDDPVSEPVDAQAVLDLERVVLGARERAAA